MTPDTNTQPAPAPESAKVEEIVREHFYPGPVTGSTARLTKALCDYLSSLQAEALAQRPTDAGERETKRPLLDKSDLQSREVINHPDAYLGAALDFSGSILAHCIANGLKARDLADGFQHLESALRGLHAMALSAILARPDAEPVAWRWKYGTCSTGNRPLSPSELSEEPWRFVDTVERPTYLERPTLQPLYAAPPAPDHIGDVNNMVPAPSALIKAGEE